MAPLPQRPAKTRAYYNGITWIVDSNPSDKHDHVTEHCAVSEDGKFYGTAIFVDGLFECIDEVEDTDPKPEQD